MMGCPVYALDCNGNAVPGQGSRLDPLDFTGLCSGGGGGGTTTTLNNVLWSSSAAAAPSAPPTEPASGQSIFAVDTNLNLATHYRSGGAWVKNRFTHTVGFGNVGAPLSGDPGVQQARWSAATSARFRLGIARSEASVAGSGAWTGQVKQHGTGTVLASFSVSAGSTGGTTATVTYASGSNFNVLAGNSIYMEFTNVPTGNDENVLTVVFLVDQEVI